MCHIAGDGNAAAYVLHLSETVCHDSNLFIAVHQRYILHVLSIFNNIAPKFVYNLYILLHVSMRIV